MRNNGKGRMLGCIECLAPRQESGRIGVTFLTFGSIFCFGRLLGFLQLVAPRQRRKINALLSQNAWLYRMLGSTSGKLSYRDYFRYVWVSFLLRATLGIFTACRAASAAED